MIPYQTPGVYYERLDASAPRISAVRTDVAGFVGIAERGPLDTRVPIQSWRQFQAHFGGFTGSGFLAYAVRAFFENGGRRCWVVRVASKRPGQNARPARVIVRDGAGGGKWEIAASSPGAWGNQLTIELREVRRAQAKTIPAESDRTSSTVSTTSSFQRRGLVRLSQVSLSPPEYRVVSEVDHRNRRLIWVNQDPSRRLRTDQPLSGSAIGEPIFVESIDYTLLVRAAGRVVAVFEGLSLVAGHPRYAPDVLSSIYERPERKHVPPIPRPIVVAELNENSTDALNVPAGPTFLQDGADGLAALTPYDFIGEESAPQDSDLMQTSKRRGIRELDRVDEVSLIAVPDVHIQPIAVPDTLPLERCVPDPCLPTTYIPPTAAGPLAPAELPPVFSEAVVFQVQDALVRHCEQRGDRFAILDPPASLSQGDQQQVAGILAWRRGFESKYAAIYYPWVRVVDPLRRRTGAGSTGSSLTRDVPPSGHVAGQYAGTDFSVGVHKAPANVPLNWIQDVTVEVDDSTHGVLNPEGINVIRVFPGRGIRVYGARTVSSDADWRYVSVCRLMMMIREAVNLSLQWSVFEPNDFYTRAKIRLAISSFLTALWQRGALKGDVAEAAFFVKCDEANNPPYERDRGKLLAEVGFAPATPFEFVVLRIGRTENEFEFSETTILSGAV